MQQYKADKVLAEYYQFSQSYCQKEYGINKIPSSIYHAIFCMVYKRINEILKKLKQQVKK